MKRMKFVSLLCCVTLLFSVAAGCNNKSTKGGANTLQIYCVDLGYGWQWAQDLATLFAEQDWVKEKYPDLKIDPVQHNQLSTFAQTKLDVPKNNDFDVLLSTHLVKNAGPGSNSLDLTDLVYNQDVPGENIKFIDKMLPSYVESNQYVNVNDNTDIKYYYTSWASGITSIVYDQDILDRYNLECPRTTDELIAAAAAIKADKSKSGNSEGFSFFSGSTGYWSYLFEGWWAQYDGIDAFNNFWKGYYDDDGMLVRSNKIFDLEGRLKSLEVYEKILKYEDGYVNLAVDSQQFQANQTAMLQGQYAFMPNGDWFDTEVSTIREGLKKNGDELHQIRIMPQPIVSSIIDREECASIENDAELSALIKAIDKGETALTGEGYSVTQEAFDKIVEARRVVRSIGPGHHAIIPKYSDAQDVAVDFLRFMATDVANEQYIKTTQGASLPFIYNVKEKAAETYNSLTIFHQERLDYFNNPAYEIYSLPDTSNFPLNLYGGMKAIEGTYNFYVTFSAQGNTTTPQKLFDDTKKVWTAQKFQLALEQAGLHG